jgi:hypothetical protein
MLTTVNLREWSVLVLFLDLLKLLALLPVQQNGPERAVEIRLDAFHNALDILRRQ